MSFAPFSPASPAAGSPARPRRLVPIAAALLALAAAVPGLAADLIDGTVLAHDRVANVIVLSDRSVWTLENLETPLPDDLVAGDRIEIRYESNEDDGLRVIYGVKRLP